MKLLWQSAQSTGALYCRVRSGQMSITFWTNSLITVSLTLSRKTGFVVSWSRDTSWSSPPGAAKYVARNCWSSVLLLSGLVSLL